MKPFIMTASLSASRILCVDDDPNMLMSVKLNLRRFFQVEAAASAEEGLIALKQKGPFAVILSDMNMPGMDGSSFLNEASYLAPDTVRIMITGESDQMRVMFFNWSINRVTRRRLLKQWSRR